MKNENLKQAELLKIRRTMDALEKNNISAYYAEDAAAAVAQVQALLRPGDVISCGGSVTLDECGVKALMRSGAYTFLDREAAPDRAGQMEIYRKTFSANAFLTSSNAITENGELYNVDGNGNRVAAMLFGPEKVIVVAGYNKIVPDLQAAAVRVKAVATPANVLRLGLSTPCGTTACPGLRSGVCSGCKALDRICCLYTVIAHQRTKGRMHVILVGEPLGY